MEFAKQLVLDEAAVLGSFGYDGRTSTAEDEARLKKAAALLQKAAAPRWVYRRIAVTPEFVLMPDGLQLSGGHIAAHLTGCEECLLLAVTLGAQVEREIRAAESTDMAFAVTLDSAASVLVEQYADEAEHCLREQAENTGEYVTGRFSPGYGDFPLQLQASLLRCLNAQRAIGLTVSQSGIMLPGKSITAVLGVAGHPVKGKLAGCETCSMKERCNRKKGDTACAEHRC